MRKGKTDIQADFSIADGSKIDAIQTDTTLPTNSDLKIPTEKAVKGFKPTDLNITSQAVEDFILFDGSNWVAKGGTEKIFVSTTSRDVSVTGTQAITGIGFKPSAIQIMTTIASAVGTFSIGYFDGSNGGLIFDKHVEVANAYSHASNNLVIRMQVAFGAETNGFLTSFDSDGFTLNWTKSGSPTGTAQIKFMAFR